MGRRKDEEQAKGVIGIAVLLAFTGAAGAAWRFVEQWWPLFALGGLGLLSGLVLLIHRQRARNLAAATRQLFLDTQVATTDAMTGHQFEDLVARLLHRDGFADARVMGGSGDLGADVTAVDPAGRRLVVQCKRYAPHRGVSSPDMQKFLGTVWDEHHADLAWYVTTSGFSKPATGLAARRGVRLVDRQQLAEWMAGSSAASMDGAAPTPIAVRPPSPPTLAVRGSRTALRAAYAVLPLGLAMGFLFDVAGVRTLATGALSDHVTGGIQEMVEGNRPPEPVPAHTP